MKKRVQINILEHSTPIKLQRNDRLRENNVKTFYRKVILVSNRNQKLKTLVFSFSLIVISLGQSLVINEGLWLTSPRFLHRNCATLSKLQNGPLWGQNHK